jgi:hypothetical protein
MVSFTPLALYPVKRAPGAHWIRGWVGPRGGLDDFEKRKFLTLPGLKLRTLGLPARSQLLYRLRHPCNWCEGRQFQWFLCSSNEGKRFVWSTPRHFAVVKTNSGLILKCSVNGSVISSQL